MSCNKPYDVVAYLKGELDPVEQTPARAHVDTCDSCRGEVAKLDRVLHALGKMEAVDPTPDFRWRVRQAFVSAHPEFIERPVPGERLTLWESLKAQFSFVPAWSVSLAAHAILLAIAVAMFASPENPEDKFEKSVNVVPPKNRVLLKPPFEDPREYDHRPAPKYDPRLKALTPETLKDWTSQRVERPFDTFVAGRTTLKEALRKDLGGSGTAPAVERALKWLASQQEADGRWNAAKHGGLREYEVGITGLALLAFLADGHTHRSGAHADTVKRGVQWLLAQQKRDGLIGDPSGNYMYNHGIGALAVVECWIMTRDESLQAPAEFAVSFTQGAQSKGGWDYQARGPETDTSVGGWQIHLLRLARENGNGLVLSNLMQARDRLSELTSQTDGRVGYRTRAPGPNGPYALTALGAFAHLMSSALPVQSVLEKFRQQLQEGLPLHNITGDRKSSDLYFLYWGTLASHQMGDRIWDEWNAAVKPAVLQAQQADGSWAANLDRWSQHGGQIYTTAMATLVLETYYRYPRLVR